MTHTHDHRKSGAWSEHAHNGLVASGARQSGARDAVIEVIADAGCGVDALEIEERLRAGKGRIGRASIYRTLERLTELGLLHRLDIGGETTRWERVEPNGEHHHHMVCDDCGRVLPFSDEDLERAVELITNRAGFDVREHEVVLRGSCEACAA